MNKNTDKLSNFMNGLTAAVQLSQRAGENGEYHTLVTNGPLFKKKIEITKSNSIRRDRTSH